MALRRLLQRPIKLNWLGSGGNFFLCVQGGCRLLYKLPGSNAEIPPMDILGSAYSPSCVLNEQIARQVFDILPEDGPVMIIVSKQGNYWPSDTEGFAKLGITDGFLKDLCAKVDDGEEPVITQVHDFSIVATSLATDRTDSGYVILALPNYNPESTLANLTLIEIMLSQVGLIAHLIEKCNLLYERQMKQFSACSHAASDSILN